VGLSAFLAVEIAVSTNTWSSQMIGVEVPKPGSFAFHFTRSLSLQLVGGAPCGATPVAWGPRHCGQLR